MKHGIIFWSNSSYSKMTFTLQKRSVTIMSGAKPRHSYKSIFTRLGILPLTYEYIFLLMNFIVNNHEHFQSNLAIHSVNTRNRNHLSRPTSCQSLMFSRKCILFKDQNIQFYHLFSSLMNKKA
jgi:hypothetical protein